MNVYIKITLFAVLIISSYVVYDYFVNKRKPYIPDVNSFKRNITQKEANKISLKMFLMEQNKKDIMNYDIKFNKYKKYLNDNSYNYEGYPIAYTYYK